MSGPASTAQSAGKPALRVVSGGAPQHVLEGLAPGLERRIGRPLDLSFAIVGAVMKRLADGEPADVVMLPDELIGRLADTVSLVPRSRTRIARVGIGVIVAGSAAPPDISDAGAVRSMLLAARAIALPDPGTPSGRYLAGMIERLGIAGEVSSRIRAKGAIHGGGELVARGEADVGLYLVSEVRTVPGTTVVGLLPAELQSHVVYGAAIPAATPTPADAEAFIRCLTDQACDAAWAAGGFEPMRADRTART
jgi:molybdate transport system substrate-binding protein